MSNPESALPITMSIPQFGRIVFEIGENSSYAAAERGDIPTIVIGCRKRVPVRVALRRLAGDDPSMLERVTADFLQKLGKVAA